MRQWIDRILDRIFGPAKDLGEVEDEHQAERNQLKYNIKMTVREVVSVDSADSRIWLS